MTGLIDGDGVFRLMIVRIERVKLCLQKGILLFFIRQPDFNKTLIVPDADLQQDHTPSCA